MHQKVMLVDDTLATVGTANFDNRSLRLNFEITVLSHDRDFARDIEQMLEKDFSQATEMQNEDLRNDTLIARFISRLLRLFSPIL